MLVKLETTKFLIYAELGTPQRVTASGKQRTGSTWRDVLCDSL